MESDNVSFTIRDNMLFYLNVDIITNIKYVYDEDNVKTSCLLVN